MSNLQLIGIVAAVAAAMFAAMAAVIEIGTRPAKKAAGATEGDGNN